MEDWDKLRLTKSDGTESTMLVADTFQDKGTEYYVLMEEQEYTAYENGQTEDFGLLFASVESSAQGESLCIVEEGKKLDRLFSICSRRQQE